MKHINSGIRSYVLRAFICFILLSAISCSGRVAGTYVSERNDKQYLELKSDGTFFLKENMTMHGKYEIEGDVITLKTDVGLATQGKIDGNVLIDDDGVRWVKK